MVYVSIKEIALKWNISAVQVCNLCKQGRIEGAIKIKGKWNIPISSKKPNRARKSINNKFNFMFIDLFAGIGGFHQAMRYLGGKCLMAAEIDENCINTYKLNFKTKDIRGDVNDIDPKSIGNFDVLCAGFPCQPFSKAGIQKGFNDKTRGNLFYKIMNILDEHPEVKFVILENVRNLADKSENWDIITSELTKRNFYITEKPIILSPSEFGIPQIRERVYILGIRKDIRNEEILNNGCIHAKDLQLDIYKKKCKMGDTHLILEDNVSDDYIISEEQELMINAWEEFRVAININKIGYPIWIDCFGLGIDDTSNFFDLLGYYDMPRWKQIYLERNRELYLKNRVFIDSWVKKYHMLNRIKLYRKFEWNCGTDINDIKNAVIQIRQSGIRIKRPTYFPSLVAMVNTPIIWDKIKNHYRYITPREAANLQSFHKKYKFCGSDKIIYKQLGNSVNVRVLKILAERLFALAEDGWEEDDYE